MMEGKNKNEIMMQQQVSHKTSPTMTTIGKHMVLLGVKIYDYDFSRVRNPTVIDIYFFKSSLCRTWSTISSKERKIKNPSNISLQLWRQQVVS